MQLIYLDESGNTGNNLNDPQQPVFVLGALVVPDKIWQVVEQDILDVATSFFGGNLPDPFEIHATDIRNGGKLFRNISISRRIEFSSDLLQIAINHKLKLVCRAITKKRYQQWIHRTLGSGVSLNPHIAAYPLLTQTLNQHLRELGEGEYGILINDENKDVGADIEKTIRLLRADTGILKLDHIIEKSFFIDSQKSYVLQLADLCIYYVRKLEEVKLGLPLKSIDTKGIEKVETLIHRGQESMPDVLNWLSEQYKKRSGEDPRGIESPGGGRSRR